jgi:hypothetical protein
VKAISLWQPWASAIAAGVKQIETRGRRTSHRGPIAIHAAKKDTAEMRACWNGYLSARLDLTEYASDYSASFRAIGIRRYEDLPRGCIVATADLIDCVSVEDAQARNWVIPYERTWGDYSPGRFAWILKNIKPLAQPVRCRGMQCMFEWQPAA